MQFHSDRVVFLDNVLGRIIQAGPQHAAQYFTLYVTGTSMRVGFGGAVGVASPLCPSGELTPAPNEGAAVARAAAWSAGWL